jgi:hypothetical protein
METEQKELDVADEGLLGLVFAVFVRNFFLKPEPLGEVASAH